MYRPKLFAGIDLDSRVRRECAQIAARLEAQGVRARFEPAQKLHVTLAFLGWVDADQVEPIAQALRAAASACKGFTLQFDKVGAFPHERKPRIIWIGCREQGEEFRNVAAALRIEYGRLGFNFEKDAVTHVTIARVKEGNAHLPVLDFKPVRLSVKELTLFESLPAGRTTHYEPRVRAPLQGRAAPVRKIGPA